MTLPQLAHTSRKKESLPRHPSHCVHPQISNQHPSGAYNSVHSLAILRRAIRKSNLSFHEKTLLLYFAETQDRFTGILTVTDLTIASDLSMGERTVRKYLQRLVDRNIIERRHWTKTPINKRALRRQINVKWDFIIDNPILPKYSTISDTARDSSIISDPARNAEDEELRSNSVLSFVFCILYFSSKNPKEKTEPSVRVSTPSGSRPKSKIISQEDIQNKSEMINDKTPLECRSLADEERIEIEKNLKPDNTPLAEISLDDEEKEEMEEPIFFREPQKETFVSGVSPNLSADTRAADAEKLRQEIEKKQEFKDQHRNMTDADRLEKLRGWRLHKEEKDKQDKEKREKLLAESKTTSSGTSRPKPAEPQTLRDRLEAIKERNSTQTDSPKTKADAIHAAILEQVKQEQEQKQIEKEAEKKLGCSAKISKLRDNPTGKTLMEVRETLEQDEEDRLPDWEWYVRKLTEIYPNYQEVLDLEQCSLETVQWRMRVNHKYDPFTKDQWWNDTCHPLYALMDEEERQEYFMITLEKFCPKPFHYTKSQMTMFRNTRERIDDIKASYYDYITAMIENYQLEADYGQICCHCGPEIYEKWLARGRPEAPCGANTMHMRRIRGKIIKGKWWSSKEEREKWEWKQFLKTETELEYTTYSNAVATERAKSTLQKEID